MPQKSHTYLKSRKLLVGVLALMLLAAALQVMTAKLAPRADAASSTLCVGFSSCGSKGMSAAGYRSHWHKMFWMMFPYRNCVNYAAYRVIQNGGPATRPWTGSGNATNWGAEMSHITDNTPTRGSIAWWRAYEGGTSQYGHVAYVEKVISPNEILISESNYGSDFSWRRITKGSSWPTGFIHFSDRKKVRNVVKPKVAGQVAVGKTVGLTQGKWAPMSRPGYQWYAGGQAIRGADERRFTITKGQLGKRLSVRVTATKKGYQTGSIRTAPSAPVTAGAIRNITPPRITGEAKVGSTLGLTQGKWAPMSRPGYQWYADGKAIPGATERRFTVTKAQQGTRLSVRVTATRKNYATGSLMTAKTGPVVAGPVPRVRNLVAPQVAGPLQVGGTVGLTRGTWQPMSRPAYQWYADGQPISGATERRFTILPAQAGSRLSVRVTATREGYRTGSLMTSPSGVVAERRIRNVVAPQVLGTPKVGRTVGLTRGEWNPGGIPYFQWYADGQKIPGADQRRFTITAAQAGKRLSVQVTATKPGWNGATLRTKSSAPVQR